jgi:hypothetical protein
MRLRPQRVSQASLQTRRLTESWSRPTRYKSVCSWFEQTAGESSSCRTWALHRSSLQKRCKRGHSWRSTAAWLRHQWRRCFDWPSGLPTVVQQPQASLRCLMSALSVVSVMFALAATSPMSRRSSLHRMQRESRAQPKQVLISTRTQTVSSGCGELNSYASPKMYCNKLSAELDSIHPQSLRSHIHSIFPIRQPVAICKLHMFSGAKSFVCVLEIKNIFLRECASRIGDKMVGQIER